ncbi:hypothetical protein BGZ46_007328, partial [Entomortierella lignicola]
MGTKRKEADSVGLPPSKSNSQAGAAYISCPDQLGRMQPRLVDSERWSAWSSPTFLFVRRAARNIPGNGMKNDAETEADAETKADDETKHGPS